MPYVKHLKSSLQGGVDCEIGPKTLIVGANGTGKSSITRTLQLALTGTVSEVEGRFDVTASDRIARLFDRSLTEAPRWAVATFDDGTQARWSVPEGKKEGMLTVSGGQFQFDRNFVEPLALVRAATLAGDDKQRAFFLAHVGVVASPELVSQRLPTRLAARYARLRTELDPSGVLLELDLLAKARDACDAKAREATKTAKTLKESLSSSAAGLAPQEFGRREKLAAAVKDLEGKLQAVRETGAAEQATALQARRAALELQERRARLEADAAQADAEVVRLRDDGVKTKAEIEGLTTKMQALEIGGAVKPEHRRYLTMVEETVERIEAQLAEKPGKTGRCICCGQPAELAMLLQRRDTARAWIDKNDQAGQARHGLTLELTAAEATLARLRRAYDTAVARASAVTAQLQELPEALEVPDAPAGPDVSGISAQLESARRELSVCMTGEEVWKRVGTLRDEAAEAEAAVPEWKALREELSRVMAELLNTGLLAFREKVQAFLPLPDNFGVRVVGADMKRLEFGLLRQE